MLCNLYIKCYILRLQLFQSTVVIIDWCHNDAICQGHETLHLQLHRYE